MRSVLLAAVATAMAFASPGAAQTNRQVGLGKNLTVTTDTSAAAAKKAAKDQADADAAAKDKADKQAAEKKAAAEAAARAAAEAQAAQRAAAEAAAAQAAADAAAAESAAQAAAAKSAHTKAEHDAHENAAVERGNQAKKAAEDRVKNGNGGGNNDGSIPTPDSAISFLLGTSGQEFGVDYTGYVDAAIAPGLGGFGLFRFLGSNDGLTWNFEILELKNISSMPITASRLSGYGFNVEPNASSVTATGLFNTVAYNGNVPMLGNREICIDTQGNPSCAGNGGGGLNIGQSINSGGFSITFANAQNSLTLDKFFVRFQSISGAANGDSGVGTGVISAVPEPGQWAMLIAGFAIVGGAMRVQRRRELAVA